MHGLVLDLRTTLRRLRRSPGYVLFSVAALGFGIGASATIYAVVAAWFWAPLAIDRAEEVFGVQRGARLVVPGISWQDYQDLRAQQTAFSSLCASRLIRAAIAGGGAAAIVAGEAVSRDYFAMLGVTPIRGRLFQPDDEASERRVVVVSESFWRRRLGTHPGVVGLEVSIAGEVFTIVGVTKGRFAGLLPAPRSEFWIPILMSSHHVALAIQPHEHENRRAPAVVVWGRIAPGMTPERASSQLRLISRRLDANFPASSRTHRNWTIGRNAQQSARLDQPPAVAAMVLTVAILIVIIASFSVSNLRLARATARLHETAVRTALGASRARLVREQLLELAILTLLAAALGWSVVSAVLPRLSIDVPLFLDANMAFSVEASAGVLGAAAVGSMLALFVAGVWPAIQSTKRDVRNRLEEGVTSTAPKWRFHRTIIAWQVAGSVGLFLAAGACISVIRARSAVESAAGLDRTAIFQFDLKANGRGPTHAAEFADRLIESARAQSGAERVGATAGLPLRGLAPSATVRTPEGRSTAERAALIAATPDLLAALSIAVVEGRRFTDRDDLDGRLVAIVNRPLSRSLFSDAHVVGRTILVGGEPGREAQRRTIVGVVGGPTTDDSDTASPMVFVPFGIRSADKVAIVVLARTGAAALAHLRAAIQRVDPSLVPSLSGTGPTIAGRRVWPVRAMARLATAGGGVALALALAGLCGVLSHVVTLRTREIGIRRTLGAGRWQVFAMILTDGLQPVATGVAIAYATGLLAPALARALVVGAFGSVGLLPLIVVGAVVTAVSVGACSAPAWQATRVDPNVALRNS